MIFIRPHGAADRYNLRHLAEISCDVPGVTGPGFVTAWSVTAAMACHCLNSGNGGNSQSQQQEAENTGDTQGSGSPVTAGGSSPLNSNGSQIVLASGANLSADPIVENNAVNAITQVVQGILAAQNQTAQDVVTSNNQNETQANDLLSSVLNQDQTLAQNEATPDISTQNNANNTVLWVAGIFGAALVAIMIWRKN